MAPVRNGRHLFNQVPSGYPEPGITTIQDDSQTIDIDNVPLNGSILVKTIALSIDPYQRGLMRDASDKKHYASAYTIGKPILNHGTGVVLRSENPEFKAGDHVYVPRMPYQEYNVLEDGVAVYHINNKANLPLRTYVGAAGMAGQTAFCGWKEYSSAKKGETVFVSAGAGAVGSLVIQLAKMDGLRVIASAGSDEKVEYLKELGADVAFNYKTTDTREVLKREPRGIDIYWDNVGGSTLQAAIDNAAKYARLIICGLISGYNGQEQPGTNLRLLLTMEMKMYGFLIPSILPKYRDEFYDVVPGMLADGKLKFREHVYQGLESSGQGFYDIQSGRNNGKVVVVVADE